MRCHITCKQLKPRNAFLIITSVFLRVYVITATSANCSLWFLFFKVPVYLPPSLSDLKSLTGDSSKEGLWKLMRQVRKGEEMWWYLFYSENLEPNLTKREKKMWVWKYPTIWETRLYLHRPTNFSYHIWSESPSWTSQWIFFGRYAHN